MKEQIQRRQFEIAIDQFAQSVDVCEKLMSKLPPELTEEAVDRLLPRLRRLVLVLEGVGR